MRILLVKLSSLGDVIHNLPVVSDLARMRPDVKIEWATEAPYAGLVAMHPGVKQVWPVHLRQLKKNWWSPAAWSAFFADRRNVRARTYDLALDTQGLIKSARVARWAGAPITGQSAATAREPFAARYYRRTFDIPRDLHAVTRNRLLAARAFDYEMPEVDYGIEAPKVELPWLPANDFAVFLHATSRADKMWPDTHWIDLGKRLGAQGTRVLLPWGSAAERATSERLAAAIPDARVPPALNLIEAAAMLARAKQVVGVDTGLAHLAVALKRPTVGLYITTSPKLTGLFGGGHLINLGDGSPAAPSVPAVEDVLAALKQLVPA